MYRLLPLLGDAGLGILSIVFVSFYYERTDVGAFWLMPFAFIPDLDTLPEFWRRGKLAASAENPTDHRDLLHKPILWVLVLGVWWLWSGFYGTVACVIVFVHFLHDSVLTGWGVPWFAPFSNIRVKFFVDEHNEVSLAQKDWVRMWDPIMLKKAIVSYGNENWIEDLYLRPTVVSIIEYSIFGASVVVLTIFLI